MKKRPGIWNVVGNKSLTIFPILRSVRYIVSELFVEAFHAAL